MTRLRSAAGSVALIGALTLIVAGNVSSPIRYSDAPITAPGSAKIAPVTPCSLEDGSEPGQRFPCMWDASTQGNGLGTSYVLTMAVCSLEQVALADESHAAGTDIDLPCDDRESLIP